MKKIYMQPTTELVKTDLKLMQVTSVGITSEEGSADTSRKSRMFVDDGQDYYDEEMEATAGQSTVSSQSLWD